MEQLLTKIDDNIGKTRMLSSPHPRHHSPDQPAPPSHTVYSHYHTPCDPQAQLDAGAHQHANQINTAPRRPYHSSHQQQGAACAADHAYHGDEQPNMLSCSQFLQQSRQPGQPRSPGRREKYGVRPRVSASDVVPPERVAEDALRATRMQYFADLQRLQQKRQSDALGMQ